MESRGKEEEREGKGAESTAFFIGQSVLLAYQWKMDEKRHTRADESQNDDAKNDCFTTFFRAG